VKIYVCYECEFAYGSQRQVISTVVKIARNEDAALIWCSELGESKLKWREYEEREVE